MDTENNNFTNKHVKCNSSTRLSLNSGYFMSWNCCLYCNNQMFIEVTTTGPHYTEVLISP